MKSKIIIDYRSTITFNGPIMKYPPLSQNSLNTSKKITGNGLISPLALYFECGNNEIPPPPTIIELYRWKEKYPDKENLCITTGVLVCFSLERGGHSMIGGSKKSNWIIYIPPFCYLFIIFLSN